jgi:hypothetical protein
MPEQQASPNAQRFPQLPQLLGSDIGSLHALEQQNWPAAQTVPQAPQLLESAWVSTQVPLHSV